jgi:hypothetical protein
VPGIQDFTYANYGSEATRGTPVAPTRKLYANGTGVLDHDLGITFHEDENRGIRVRAARASSQSEDVSLALETADGVGYDDLVLLILSLVGGATGVGAGADRVWSATPSLTAANAPKAFSWDVGDDVQNWRVQYGMLQDFTLSSALGEMTQLAMTWAGQRAIKGAKATPADNAAIKIPGDLWTIKFAASIAGLAGASVQTNFLTAWKLKLQTGNKLLHYMDGTPYVGQHVETSVAGDLELVTESTATAVSEFYDKYVAGTLDFLRLRATGPTLGGSNYQATFDSPVLWGKPSIIDSARNGVNLWKMPGRIAVDSPTAPTVGPSLVVTSSLTAAP